MVYRGHSLIPSASQHDFISFDHKDRALTLAESVLVTAGVDSAGAFGSSAAAFASSVFATRGRSLCGAAWLNMLHARAMRMVSDHAMLVTWFMD